MQLVYMKEKVFKKKKKKTAMFYGCLNLEQRKGNGKQILNKMPSVWSQNFRLHLNQIEKYNCLLQSVILQSCCFTIWMTFFQTNKRDYYGQRVKCLFPKSKRKIFCKLPRVSFTAQLLTQQPFRWWHASLVLLLTLLYLPQSILDVWSESNRNTDC